MFIIILTYQAPLLTVDQWLTAHRDYLSTCYDRQLLLLSGPQNPRTGGILISPLSQREQIDDLIQHDPFYQQKIADYQVIEFTPVKYHTALKSFIA